MPAAADIFAVRGFGPGNVHGVAKSMHVSISGECWGKHLLPWLHLTPSFGLLQDARKTLAATDAGAAAALGIQHLGQRPASASARVRAGGGRTQSVCRSVRFCRPGATHLCSPSRAAA